MGNCVDKGDSNAGADGKLTGIAAFKEGAEFNQKGEAGRVVCKILADNKFELKEFEGEGEEAKTSWAGNITEADGVVTFDASEGEAEPKTFLPTFEESGNLKFNHKFIGDIEELAP